MGQGSIFIIIIKNLLLFTDRYMKDVPKDTGKTNVLIEKCIYWDRCIKIRLLIEGLSEVCIKYILTKFHTKSSAAAHAYVKNWKASRFIDKIPLTT